MAVYQYFLAVIPKNGIIKKYEKIPSKIKISTETGYFEFDSEIYWNEVKINVEKIINQIDSIIERAKWGNEKTSYNWKYYSEILDNDASIYLNESNLKIKEFSFRADLRDENLEFMKSMISLGKENEWLFMDRNGILMNPDFKEIKESVQNSNAFSFIKDPHKFLDNLNHK